jgi:membrane protease YdiL (CAAX protease family)
MARTKFSHTVNKQQREKEADKEKWFLSYDWMLLFFAAIFSGIIVTTMYQTTSPEIVDIAVYQIILGMVGLMIGTTMNVRKGVVTPGLRVGMPTREDGEKIFVYVTGGFIGLEIFNQVITSVKFSVFDNIPQVDAQMNIALTAAVMEEALYSFAFTTFFFAIFLYMIVKVTARYNEGVRTAAMVSASIMVGVLFVLIHVGVYGFDPNIVIMLFVNRFVYSILYIKTRNLSVPTLLHLAHNAMIFLPI